MLALKTFGDGIRLVINSVGSLPTGPGVSLRGNIAAGKVTDVLVRGNNLGAPPAGGADLEVSSFVNLGDRIMLVYIYNWQSGQWQVGGVTFLIGAGEEGGDPGTNGTIVAFPIGDMSPFVRSDGEIQIRLWTISLGVSPDYTVFHDLVRFDFNSDDFVPGLP